MTPNYFLLRSNFVRRFVLIALALGATIVAAGCTSSSAKKSQSGGAAPAGIPVTVAVVALKTIPLELRVIGNVESYSSVSLKSQVSARVVSVNFKEGQDVRKGDLLFTLDKRPLEAEQQQNQAALERDIARSQNAAAQAKRYAELLKEGVVSKQNFDDLSSSAQASEATVRADQAAIESTKLKIAYTSILSPIDGRTGSILVYPGNLAKENDVPVLVVINQIQPIYVNFAVSEQFLTEIKKYMAQRTLAVEAAVPQQEDVREQGMLTFVDNTVDRVTGTIHLKATFQNKQRRLWPGQFVNVTLKLAQELNRTVVPAQAVQTGQGGQYVYVVKADKTVEARLVTVTRTIADQAVIDKGLTVGETVVTDGQLRLVPGAKVEIKGGL